MFQEPSCILNLLFYFQILYSQLQKIYLGSKPCFCIYHLISLTFYNLIFFCYFLIQLSMSLSQPPIFSLKIVNFHLGKFYCPLVFPPLFFQQSNSILKLDPEIPLIFKLYPEILNLPLKLYLKMIPLFFKPYIEIHLHISDLAN